MKFKIITICLMLIFLAIFYQKAEAFLSMSDKLSDSGLGVGSIHSVSWKVGDASGISAGEGFGVSFDVSFDTSQLINDDIKIWIDSTERSLSDSCAGLSDFGVQKSGNVFNFEVCAGLPSVSSGSLIEIEFGSEGNIAGQIINPSLPGGYIINVDGSGGYADSDKAEILISDGKNVSFSVGSVTGRLILSGKTSPNSTIYVYEKDSLIGTLLVGAGGNFSKTIAGFSVGIHNIGFWCRDFEGNKSETIEEQINISQGQDTKIVGILFSPTLKMPESTKVKRSSPYWVGGRTILSSKLGLNLSSERDNYSGEYWSDRAGVFLINLNPKLHLGIKNFRLISYDGLGGISQPTKSYQFEVIRTADINNDNLVDMDDLSIFKNDYEVEKISEVLSDINDNNVCDLSDLSIMMHDWSK